MSCTANTVLSAQSKTCINVYHPVDFATAAKKAQEIKVLINEGHGDPSPDFFLFSKAKGRLAGLDIEGNSIQKDGRPPLRQCLLFALQLFLSSFVNRR